MDEEASLRINSGKMHWFRRFFSGTLNKSCEVVLVIGQLKIFSNTWYICPISRCCSNRSTLVLETFPVMLRSDQWPSRLPRVKYIAERNRLYHSIMAWEWIPAAFLKKFRLIIHGTDLSIFTRLCPLLNFKQKISFFGVKHKKNRKFFINILIRINHIMLYIKVFRIGYSLHFRIPG